MEVPGTETFNQPTQPAQNTQESDKNNASGQSQETQPSVIVFNGKVFNSQKEMLEYAGERDMKASFLESQTANSQQASTQQKEKWSDTIFVDPDSYTEKVLETAVSRIKNELSAKEQAETARKTFFDKFPDLRENDDLVAYYAGKMKGQVENLPVEQQYTKLATEVRARISKLKGEDGKTTELESKPANVLGSGSGRPISPETKEAPRSFAEQIKSMQRKRK